MPGSQRRAKLVVVRASAHVMFFFEFSSLKIKERIKDRLAVFSKSQKT